MSKNLIEQMLKNAGVSHEGKYKKIVEKKIKENCGKPHAEDEEEPCGCEERVARCPICGEEMQPEGFFDHMMGSHPELMGDQANGAKQPESDVQEPELDSEEPVTSEEPTELTSSNPEDDQQVSLRFEGKNSVKEEATGIDYKKVLKKYLYQEDRNYHTENYFLLAKYFGSDAEKEKAKDLQDTYNRKGYLNDNEKDWLYKTFNKHYRTLVKLGKDKEVVKETENECSDDNNILEEDLTLSKADKRVIMAFLDKQKASSKKIESTGTQLDGLWMGGTNIAHWKDDKVVIGENRPHGRSDQTIIRFIRKHAPRLMLGETDNVETNTNFLNDVPSEWMKDTVEQNKNDNENKTDPVPSEVKQAMDEKMKEFAEKAKKFENEQRALSQFYKDLMAVAKDIMNHFNAGTVEEFKKGQILALTLKSTMMDEFPPLFWDFVGTGRDRKSLKDYFNVVRNKED